MQFSESWRVHDIRTLVCAQKTKWAPKNQNLQIDPDSAMMTDRKDAEVRPCLKAAMWRW